MLIKWSYILIGNDKTGKTNFQKYLCEKLCLETKDLMKCNVAFPIRYQPKSEYYKLASFMNRSYQEKSEYTNIDTYFDDYFEDCEISFLSSHLDPFVISRMITECKRRFFNVCGIFFSNSIQKNNEDNNLISSLPFDHRIIINNPIQENWEPSLKLEAGNLVSFIANR